MFAIEGVVPHQPAKVGPSSEEGGRHRPKRCGEISKSVTMPPSETPSIVVKMRTTATKKQKTDGKDGPNGTRPDGTPAKPAGSSSSAVQCCTVTQREGQTIFTCKFPGCAREYASRDAVRKHCRLRHLEWLRSLDRSPPEEHEQKKRANQMDADGKRPLPTVPQEPAWFRNRDDWDGEEGDDGGVGGEEGEEGEEGMGGRSWWQQTVRSNDPALLQPLNLPPPSPSLTDAGGNPPGFEFGFSSSDLFQALGPADAALNEMSCIGAGEAQQLLQAALARGELMFDSEGEGTPALRPAGAPCSEALLAEANALLGPSPALPPAAAPGPVPPSTLGLMPPPSMPTSAQGGLMLPLPAPGPATGPSLAVGFNPNQPPVGIAAPLPPAAPGSPPAAAPAPLPPAPGTPPDRALAARAMRLLLVSPLL